MSKAGMPTYPDLGRKVAAFRRCDLPIQQQDAAQRRAYGAAIEEAIRALQRAELNAAGRRVSLMHREPVGAARRGWLRKKLLAAPEAERRARTPDTWRKLYDAAMAEKKRRNDL